MTENKRTGVTVVTPTGTTINFPKAGKTRTPESGGLSVLDPSGNDVHGAFAAGQWVRCYKENAEPTVQEDGGDEVLVG